MWNFSLLFVTRFFNFCCLKNNEIARAYKKGLKNLKDDLDIIKILKTLRKTEHFLKNQDSKMQ